MTGLGCAIKYCRVPSVIEHAVAQLRLKRRQQQPTCRTRRPARGLTLAKPQLCRTHYYSLDPSPTSLYTTQAPRSRSKNKNFKRLCPLLTPHYLLTQITKVRKRTISTISVYIPQVLLHGFFHSVAIVEYLNHRKRWKKIVALFPFLSNTYTTVHSNPSIKPNEPWPAK